MADAFKAKVKPDKNNKIWPCKVCNVTPSEGDDLWMQNIGSEESAKWIVSPHEECFKKLQENPELGKKQSSGRQFTSAKFPITEAVNLFQLSEELLNVFLNKHETQSAFLTVQEKAIFVESIFRTLSTGYKP